MTKFKQRGPGLFDGDVRPNVVPTGWQPTPLPSLRGAKRVFGDFETTGLKWWENDRPVGIAYSVAGGPRGYAPFGHTGGNLDEETVKRWMCSEDGFAGKELYNLHTKFDAHTFRRWTGRSLDDIGCTLADVAHNAALLDDNRREFNLNKLGLDVVGRGKVDLDMSRGAHVYHAAEVEAYAINDVELVREILDVQLPQLAAQDLLEILQLENECLFPTLEMEWNGSIINQELLARWLAQSEQEYHRTLWDIAHLAGRQVNPDSPKDLADLFTQKGWDFPVIWDPYIKQPKVSFGDEGLATMAGNPLVDFCRKGKKLHSLRSKYLLKYRDSIAKTGGVLRYSLNQLRADENQGGAVSGRYSASAFKINGEEYGANPQQVFAVAKQRVEAGYDEDDASHDDEIFAIRYLFDAPRGRRYYAPDAAQIEYRIFVHFSEDAKLVQAYRDDPKINFHRHVHKLIPQLPYKAVKNVNFCKLFGGGAEKIAYMIGCSVPEAKRFIALYDQGNPSVSKMLRKATALAENRGWVRTITGRRARFPTRERTYRALNRVIQGSAADINKKKLIRLYRERKRLDLTMRLTVHDEIGGDLPDDAAAAACDAILNEQDYPLNVPILWESATGANWGECA